MPGVTRFSSTAGHAFLVHGRVESVVHDAALVPTGPEFHVRDYWDPVLQESAEICRPDGWRRGSAPEFARSAGGRAVWFVNIGGVWKAGPDLLAQRVAGALRDISRRGLSTSSGRKQPVVAVPVIGLKGTGLGARRGEVVSALLEACEEAATELGFDIVLVTPDASVYGAAQSVRRRRGHWAMSADMLERARRLGERAGRGELALFLGAGVSIPAGFPTWSELIDKLKERCQLEDLTGWEKLPAIDQAEILEHRLAGGLGKAVVSELGHGARPSLAHALLAALHCREVVTTNYDDLYEKAVEAAGQRTASVLPREEVAADRPWVLKMHGDLRKPDSVVLTRRHFVRYDAATRPAGAVLQSLLMTRHLLIVGASLADDNVVRLAYEVDAYRKENRLPTLFGTLLDVDGLAARRELWEAQLNWIEMGGADTNERGRALEVFLDAVAAFASSDSSWLLDERFGDLVARDQGLVADARRLYQRAAVAGDSWTPLAAALEKLGAAAGSHSEDSHRARRSASRHVRERHPPHRGVRAPRPARAEVADFWDDVLQRWMDGRDHLVPPLQEWLDSYKGTGEGSVDLDHYPDPYVGDLRGEHYEPRIVVLGLNPGVGYPELQSARGIWAQRIAADGYSRCLARSPEEDRTTWISLHGKRSPYWKAVRAFTEKWLQDKAAGVHDILNLELYPWHSNKVMGAITPPPEIIERFVWRPVQEVDVPAVFVFGKPWFAVCDGLGLPLVDRYGANGKPWPHEHWSNMSWRLAAYRLPSGQLAVVSSQQGGGQPPLADDRVEFIRALVAELG